MILAIDYRLAASSYRGMARYCREMTNALIKILPSNWEILLYVDKNKKNELLPINYKIKELPTSNFIIGEQFWLPIFLRHNKVNILWSPSNTFPLFISKHIKRVATIHDLIFMEKAENKQTQKQAIGRLYRKYIIKLGIQKLDGCCCVSNYTSNEIKKIFHLKKVIITFNCIDQFIERVKLYTSQHALKERGNNFFTVSGDAPSKNLEILFNWFREHKHYKLNIAGLTATSSFRRNCPENINILPPNISDNLLIEYYMTCKAFIFISKKEGFGIPLLEAMVCNCKLIISDRTSIPEIVGNNGIYVNPDSQECLTNAITNIDNHKIDESNYTEQIRKFQYWSNSAKELASLLFEIYK